VILFLSEPTKNNNYGYLDVGLCLLPNVGSINKTLKKRWLRALR